MWAAARSMSSPSVFLIEVRGAPPALPDKHGDLLPSEYRREAFVKLLAKAGRSLVDRAASANVKVLEASMPVRSIVFVLNSPGGFPCTVDRRSFLCTSRIENQ